MDVEIEMSEKNSSKYPLSKNDQNEISTLRIENFKEKDRKTDQSQKTLNNKKKEEVSDYLDYFNLSLKDSSNDKDIYTNDKKIIDTAIKVISKLIEKDIQNVDLSLSEEEIKRKSQFKNISCYTKKEDKNKKIQKKEKIKLELSDKVKKQVDVYINHPVNDIYKMASRNNNLNNMYSFYFLIVLVFSIFFTLFDMQIITYLRPVNLVNKIKCYDTIYNSFSYCIFEYYYFCYSSSEVDTSLTILCNYTNVNDCIQYFKSENNITMKTAYTSSINYLKIFEDKEQASSLLQYSGKHFCQSYSIISISFALFGIGGAIGFFLFGILSDAYGKKLMITICSILSFIFGFCFIILDYYKLEENHFSLLKTFWIINYFNIGFSFLPFQNLLHLYILELSPLTNKIKILNSVLYLKYLVGLWIFLLYSKITSKYFYGFCIYTVLMLVFIIVFIFMFPETPRYYSEKKDYIRKALVIRSFLKDYAIKYTRVKILKNDKKDNNINETNQELHVNQNSNKKEQYLFMNKITVISYIVFHCNDKEESNKKENGICNSINLLLNDPFLRKKYLLIYICYLILQQCFQLTTISFLCNSMNPYKEDSFDSYDYVKMIIIPLVILALLMVISIVLFEIIDLDVLIILCILIYFICSLFLDLNEIGDDYTLTFYIGTFVDKEKIRFKSLLQSFCFMLINYSFPIYDLMITLQVSTSCRTTFYLFTKSLSFFTIILASLTCFFFNSPNFIAGLLGGLLFALLSFMVIRFNFDMYEENVDIIEKNKQE